MTERKATDDRADEGGAAVGPGGRRQVFLDPAETDNGWAFVVVAAETGVVYQNQCGGTACLQFTQEGYLLPLFGTDVAKDISEFFVVEFEGSGARGCDWPPHLLDRLRTAVSELHVYGSANRDDVWPAPLVLDESRLAETDEAWVPVLTPDGPGILVWLNSD
ncbi:DUF6210 family protein [Streptomyces sp. NPDC001493]